MKVKKIVHPSLIIGLLSGLAVSALAKEEDEQTVDWKDVPAAVQSTITTNANGGTVTEIEKETKKGKLVYEADVKSTDGKELEIKVAEDGTLIKVKAEDDDKDGDKKDKDDKK